MQRGLAQHSFHFSEKCKKKFLKEDLNCLEHQIQKKQSLSSSRWGQNSPQLLEVGAKIVTYLTADGAKIVLSFQQMGPKQSLASSRWGQNSPQLPADGAKLIPSFQQMWPKQSLSSSRWGQNNPQLPADGAKIIPSFQQMGPK